MKLFGFKNIKIGCYPIVDWYFLYKYGKEDLFGKWIDNNCWIFENPTKRYNFAFIYVDVFC